MKAGYHTHKALIEFVPVVIDNTLSCNRKTLAGRAAYDDINLFPTEMLSNLLSRDDRQIGT